MKTIKIQKYRLNAENIVGYWPVDEGSIRMEYIDRNMVTYLPSTFNFKSKEARDDALRVIDDFIAEQ